MLKVGKRHRDGSSACPEADPTDATLKPCFTPPSTPDKKPGERGGPATPASPSFGAGGSGNSSSSSDDEEEGCMNDFAVPKRRHIARRRAVLTCARSARIEAAAAAAVDAAVLDGNGVVGTAAAVQCPCCGHTVPVPSPQKRRFTLDDIKRAFQAGLQEQGAKDRAEYELRLQQMAREYELALQRVREEYSRPSDYSYFS